MYILGVVLSLSLVCYDPVVLFELRVVGLQHVALDGENGGHEYRLRDGNAWVWVQWFDRQK